MPSLEGIGIILGAIFSAILGTWAILVKAGILPLTRSRKENHMPNGNGNGNGNGRRPLASKETIDLLDKKQDTKYCEKIHGQLCKDIDEIKIDLKTMQGISPMVKAIYYHLNLHKA